MTLTILQALSYANSRKVLLAEVQAGQHLSHWTQDGTYINTYHAATALSVVGAREDGAALVLRASLTLCNTNAGSYFFDAAAGRLYVHPYNGTPYDHTMQAVVAFRWSNHPREFDAKPFAPRIASAPSLDLRIPERFTMSQQQPGGTLEVEQAQGATPEDAGAFDALADLDWDAGHVRVSFGVDPIY